MFAVGVCGKLLHYVVMSLLTVVSQYVDECRCLMDKADGIHEKV